MAQIPPATTRPVTPPPPDRVDPRVEALVHDLIGRVADKWTMIVLEVLAQHGELRFTQVARQVPGISQKMLTQTLRGLERDGLATRTVHAEVPPRVVYELTDLGRSLITPLAALDSWAREHIAAVEAARSSYDAEKAAG